MSKRKIARIPNHRSTNPHATKLRQAAETQRWAIMAILARVDTDQAQDTALFQDLAALAANARQIEAVASFLESEVRS